MSSASVEVVLARREVPPARVSSRNQKTGYRPELQGLRALAVLMVVSYHVWFGRISGGVDVFLFISAFLLTAQFVRKIEIGDSLDLLSYWLHLFRRLLPMIVVTLMVIMLGAILLLPQTVWVSTIDQIWASLLYYQNWHLAYDSVDYYVTNHSTASPAQHFWSLSIQGQVFIIWPIIFLVAAVFTRFINVSVRLPLALMFGAIFILSFFHSLISTESNQAFAYFDTFARLWEFTLGSLLALVLPYISIGKTMRILLGWLGIVAILSCGIVLQVDQKFPGYMALWPTLATAFVIAAGSTGSRFGVDRFLSWGPLVRLGNSSYALYLLHWPILVFFLVWMGRDQAGPRGGAAVIVVSILAAFLATNYIDNPIRKFKWVSVNRSRAFLSIVLCVAIVGVPAIAWRFDIKSKEAALMTIQEQSEAESNRNYPGARSIMPGYINEADPGLAIKPALTALDKQWATIGGECEDGFVPQNPLLVDLCSQSAKATQPDKKIIIVGDSHAKQLAGALMPIAAANNWQLISLLLGACDFGTEEVPSGRSEECQNFNRASIQYILDHQPDAVFTVATNAVPDSPEETLVPGYDSAAKLLSSAGIRVIGVRDNPRFNENKAECVSRLGGDGCSFARDMYLAKSNPAAALNQLDKVHMIDLTDQYCTSDVCFAVVGNVLIYMDHNHLTWDYARTMAPALSDRIARETGWFLTE